MIPSFALVLMICSVTECTDAVENIYKTKAQCEGVIFEERFFNAECRPVDKILRMGEVDTASNYSFKSEFINALTGRDRFIQSRCL